VELIVDDTLTIDASSHVDVSDRGYLGGLRDSNNGQSGRTLNNTSNGGSTRRNGGSYGGAGGFGNAGGTVNVLYGTSQDPDAPGSGGGSDSGPAGVAEA
jgi:hypothetical protein